jgi:DNA uptake protein ComE-like DNA-binding protein
MRYLRKSSLLLISAWAMAILAVFAVGLNRLVLTRLDTCRRIQTRIIGRQLAAAAFLYAKKELLAQPLAYATLSGLGQPRRKVLNDAAFSFVVKDEEAKINVNSASQEIIARLPGLDDVLAQNITASRPYPAIEALLNLEGMTNLKFNRIKDLITVTSSGKVNINTAPEEVLKALGLREAVRAGILAYRDSQSDQPEVQNNAIFTDTGKILETLGSTASLSLDDQQNLLSAVTGGLLGVSSNYFTLKIDLEILNQRQTGYDIIMAAGKIARFQER